MSAESRDRRRIRATNAPPDTTPSPMAQTTAIETSEPAFVRPTGLRCDDTVASLRRRRRILVLGSSGAGKSHLSRDLAAILGIDAIHLDDHFRLPDGRPRPEREWRELVSRLAARDAWVMDGTYERSLDLRLPRADAIILLECPSELCLERVVERESRTSGAPTRERSRWSTHPIDPHHVGYIARYGTVTHPFVLQQIERYARGKPVAVLQAPDDVEPFLAALQDRAA